MKKSFIKFAFFGALAITSLTYVGCKDYDDDIKGLQEQIDANKKTIAEIQALLNSGQWVKSVVPSSNGVTITMGDGKTFEITNGTNGLNGQPGSVITMGDNGNWYIDGVDTGKSWKGIDGKDGQNGNDGVTPYIGENGNWFIGNTDTGIKAQGKDGQNGKDGINGNDGKDGTNGKDGVNGNDGKDGQDGTTPHIGENGNWFIGNTDTGIKAQGKDGQNGKDGINGNDGKDGTNGKDGINGTNGKDGADGKDGINGTNGKDGADGKDGINGTNGKDGINGTNGKDGIYYEPREDGFWYKIDPNKENDPGEKGESWIAAGVVTAVYDTARNILLLTVVDADNNPTVIELPISNTIALSSLAFVPEVMEDGMGVVDFYSIIKNNVPVASSNPTILYRINPTNASVKDVRWSFLNRQVTTRVAGDNSNLIEFIGEPTYPESGGIAFKVKTGQRTSTLKDKKALFALKATRKVEHQAPDENNTYDIVSDYASINVQELNQISIADTNKTKNHTFTNFSTTIPDLTKPADTTFVYTGSIDLKTLVGTYTTSITPSEYLANLGFNGITYKFSKIDEYSGEDGITNQQKFVILTGSTVKVDNAWLSQGTAACNRTPVFRADAMIGNTIIATAYIKLRITEKPEAGPLNPLNVVVACGNIEYTSINTKKTYEFTYDRMNAEVYDKIGLTNTTFFTHYDYDDSYNVTRTGVTIKAYTPDGATMTSMAYIKIENEVKFGNDTVEVHYKSKNNKIYPDVVIKFGYNIVHTPTLPELNPDYLVGNDIIEVKGKLVDVQGTKTYQMISGMKEHFKNYLSTYTIPVNHDNYRFELVPTIPVQTGVEISQVGNLPKESFKDQTIKLTSAMTQEKQDYKVQLVITLANGEKEYVKYTVRFTRPFEVNVSPVTLKTYTANPDTKDLKSNVTITDKYNTLYENGGWTDYATSTYAIDKNNTSVIFNYELNPDPSFGGHLSLSGSTLTWFNEGAVLQNDKDATGKVTVTVPNIAKVAANITIKVLSSEHSME